jgi:predicted Rossmann fold flavoprotein
MEKKKVVVVGGGAAGFFCAIQIAELHPDWEIAILEKTNKLLSKVKVSGGGRCNVTHACPDVEMLLKKYPRGERFLKKSFYQFATKNTIEWFKNNGVELHTEKDGRMFPTTNSSDTIIDCFLRKIHQYNIQLLTQHEVVDVKRNDHNVLGKKQKEFTIQ